MSLAPRPVPAAVKQPRKWWRPQFELVAVGLVLLAVVAFALWPQPWPTAENFARIRPRMTSGEVEAILGPPGDFTSRSKLYPKGERWWESRRTAPENVRVAEWRTDAGRGVVFFDLDGQVVDFVYRRRDTAEPSGPPPRPAQERERPAVPGAD
jgi:hypothetical protein